MLREILEGMDKKLKIVIDKLEQRLEDLLNDPSAKFLAPVLSRAITLLENNDVVGALEWIDENIKRANSRDTMKLEIIADYIESGIL